MRQAEGARSRFLCPSASSFNRHTHVYTHTHTHTHTHIKVPAPHLCVIFRGSHAVLSAERWQAASRFIVVMRSCPGAGLVYRLPPHTSSSLKSFVHHKSPIRSINGREVSFRRCLCVRARASTRVHARTNEFLFITGSINRGFQHDSALNDFYEPGYIAKHVAHFQDCWSHP